LVFPSSLEYDFSEVLDGDQLLLDTSSCSEEWYLSYAKKNLPQYFPLTRETLIETHGIAYLVADPTGKTSGEEQYRLEIPTMLMNHSCEPNTGPGKDDEDHALRDIKEGEELTCDYACYVYYENTPYPKCRCGSSNCRGEMKGWLGLTDQEKTKHFPHANAPIQAHYLADIGEGLPIIEQDDASEESAEDLPVRKLSVDGAFRLVCPGPGSSSDSPGVYVKQIENGNQGGKFGLFAKKDFRRGDLVYEFWFQPWPEQLPEEFDMVAPFLEEGDDEYTEGSIIRINADTCARKYRTGETKFSSWDLLTAHSTQPNVVYLHDKDEEEGSWGNAYAARDIKAGEQITADHHSSQRLVLLNPLLRVLVLGRKCVSHLKPFLKGYFN